MERQLFFVFYCNSHGAADHPGSSHIGLVSRRDHRLGDFEFVSRFLGDGAFQTKCADARTGRTSDKKIVVRFNNSIGITLTYLITDGEADTANFAEKKTKILALIKAAVRSNISFIQLREKKLPARFVFELAAESVKLTRQSRTKILINDRADIAAAAKADGVHLTSKSLSVETIRRVFLKDFIIGVSTHTLAEAENARQNGADFITFSPIFNTPGKGEPQGVEKLREVCEKLEPFPVVALGGIDAANYKAVLENGASGFAAIRFLSDPENFNLFL